MAALKLTDLAAYKAYFLALATAHKEIDGFKWGNKEVIMNDNRSDLPARFLWAMPYDNARYEDNRSDNVMKLKVARVAYMIIPDSALFADEEEAFDACEAVIEQILAKILVDKGGASVAGVWTMLVTDISSWTTGPAEKLLGSTKYIGWEMKITFKDNTHLAYDATKWN